MSKKARFPGIFAAVYTVFLLGLYMPALFGIHRNGAFANMQGIWHDFLFQVRRDSLKPGDKRLILLALDEETGKKYGFPMPRATYAPALDKMKALGVQAVAFDVMFFERREGDAELTAATRRFGNVVHLYAFPDNFAEGKPSLPIPPLLKAGRYFGAPNVDYLKQADDHVRTFQLFRPDAVDPVTGRPPSPSLAAALLSAYEDEGLDKTLARYGDKERVINQRRPVDWTRHEAGPSKSPDVVTSPFRRVSMLDLLDGTLSRSQREALKGSIVIIGSTALGYYDVFPTVFGSAPGSELHMQAIDNSLNGDSMSSPPRAYTLLLIVFAILVTYWLQRLPTAYGAALAGTAFLSWIAYAFWMFSRGVIVEFVPPAVAFGTSYLVLVAHRALTEDAEKKMIKNLFGQFVAPEVVDDLAQDPSKVKLGGEKREMTVFFLDIAHFTNISEKMAPEALIQFLNKYLSALSDVVLERHGTIDKFIGDCIMAFWNAPVANPDHRVDAILAALDCQRIIQELNKNLDSGLPEVPAARIGINSGFVTVGLTGTHKKLQYTVIGDEVNLASRLEGANKFFGSKIIVSEATYAAAKDRVAARPLGRVRVVGKATPIKIYEPIGEVGKLSPDWEKALPLYEKAVADFDGRRYAKAVKGFAAFLKIFPKDGPGHLYHDRCRDYAAIPPDKSWEGVFNLTAK